MIYKENTLTGHQYYMSASLQNSKLSGHGISPVVYSTPDKLRRWHLRFTAVNYTGYLAVEHLISSPKAINFPS